ncbi:minor head protein [Staphylococcus phage vB_SpsS_QT1]|uniref:Structural protein n=1 Tax=Staphylococcus phage vB_SpsS_QT1 TaxID=2510452 RepID=A0A4P6R1K8_9CAUD|nr:minor head protein [Staphylococcus phage vB_SpsS_QT1]QBJ05127.1 structural protein [Staphylococcus phage vB_SpsS_QT1]
MIHVMNFKGEIVDFISQSDSAVIQAVHKRDINERMETFDFTILSERTTYMQERNRIIIQDKDKQYREFIIDRISADIDGYTEVETVASYLEDITKARPYAPGKLEKMTTKQALSDVLKDTGWEVSDATEYGGLRTTSWTSYQTRYDVLLQLCTTYKMMADFYIEVGSNRVDKRLVVLRKRNPLFKGKEITYGKDLTGLKRTVDFSEIKTALLCVGPEPEEGKKRIELVVKDDESQAKYGLPGRYNWGVYEPETEDQNMTESRLRTLGTTELNKRKSEVITYEVTTIDIEKEYKHEVINLGDMVRIKNRDFTPPLYVEAEVISEEYDLISKDVTYSFGTYKEFKESDLRSSFDRKLDAIRQKVSDGLSNVNTIVRESLEGELQYFERKILKGDTPPDNPVNDLLWLDTSNPKVAVLRRYWNGEWIKSSAENADDVGAITREQALYSELNNTFVNLTIQHSRLMHEVSDVLESEYLVDTDIKEEVNSKLNDTISVFNDIKQNLDSMTSETATIGKLVDTQALFLKYREKMQALYNIVENAKIAIDERFKLLQSQYTDEKYNEAMEKIAAALPGGNWDAETGRLTGDIPNEERINEIEIALQQNLTDQINGAKQILNNQVDAKLLQLKDEITLSVRSVDEKIDGLGDGVNLLDSYNSSRPLSINKDIVSTKSFQGRYYATNLYTADYLKTILIPGETYTYSYEMEIIGLSEKEAPYSKKHGIIFYSNTMDKDRIFSYKDVERSVGNKIKYTHTFVAPEITDHRFVAYAGFYTDDGTLKYPISSNLVEITKFKLERGTKATPFTESLNDRLEPVKIRTTNAENSIKVMQDSLLLTATKTDVQRTLDEQLKPLKHEVNEQKAQLQVMSDSIDSKVSQSEYTSNLQGVVERLDNAETHRQQLSNQIADRVTRSEYENDVEQRLVNSKAEVLIEAEQTSNRVSKEVFNESSKTLERYTSEFINNVSTGMSFNYDDNGNIQSANIGPEGIKIDTSKFVINDGDVIVQNGRTTIKDAYIDKLFSNQATIEYLKATDIDLNRATVSGLKNGESTVLTGGKIRSTGSFVRTFPQGSVTYEAFTESWNGVYRAGLISKQFGNRKLTDIERWLALTDKGITTQREIHSLSPDKNGARFIDFFADESYSSNVFGQGMHIYSGQAITIESEYGFSILSNNHSYIRTQNSGFEVNMNGGGLVLKRTSPFTSQSFSGGSYVSMRSSDNVEQGHVGILSDNRNISLSSSFGSVLLKGKKVFALDKNGENRVPIYADYFSGDKLIGSIEAPDTNVYAMCHSELRVVSKDGYNGGDITYKNIRFNSWNAMSHEKFKHDIEEWNYKVLDIYKNELQLHSYKINSEAGTEYSRIHHGIILRENSNLDQFPVEWRNSDGFDGNEVLWWNAKAIQELAQENDDLKSRIKEMENKIDTILEAIK